MSNTLGNLFRFTIFGDSHGKAIGGILDGCLPNIDIDEEFIHNELKRRSTGKSFFSSTRKEPDKVEFLSGIRNSKTTGGPIGFIIANKNFNSSDYTSIDSIFRPSHADFTYTARYGTLESAGKLHASARNMASVVVAGAIAKILLKTYNINISGYVKQIGEIVLDTPYQQLQIEQSLKSPVCCPDMNTSKRMIEYLKKIKEKHDSVGGVVCCIISNCPPGIGNPVFGKLQAELSYAMFSIPGVKGFEYGAGFNAARAKGSELNDRFVERNKKIRTLTNNSGGIQGGISNGEDIYFNVAFKPPATIGIEQETITRNAKKTTFTPKGRYDICYVPRAVVIVEALSAIVMADNILKYRSYAK